MTAYSYLLKGLALSAIACGFVFSFADSAEARERGERRSERRSDDRRDNRRERDSRNDDWGYRAFIPDGGGGQIFYGDPDGFSNGNLYGGFGHSDHYFDSSRRRGGRPWRIYRHDDDYRRHEGISVSVNGDNFSLSYNKRGRPIYSAPDCAEYGYYGDGGYGQGYYNSATYVYGDGPIVLDGRPRYDDYGSARGAEYYDGPEVYNDNRSYDDNDVINNYNYDDSPVQPQRSQYIETPVQQQGPVDPRVGAGERTVGLRFYDETKLATSDGGWRLSIKGGKLYAGAGRSKGTQLASGVDEDFGAYALWTSGHGLSVIYRSAGDVFAASRDSDGSWYSAALPYNVDFRRENSLGLVSGDLWFTFSASDGLRYVVALRDGAWSELGSASGVR